MMSSFPEVAPLDSLACWRSFAQAAQNTPVNPQRLCVLKAGGLLVDTSAQRASPELAQATEALLQARQFETWREHLLTGQVVNLTENRAAWHSALRVPAPSQQVAGERERMLDFVRLADAERKWRNVVHIGIGGSDWGVRLCIAAFGYAGTWRNVRFVSNIDGHAIEGGLAGLDPHETLVVVSSKSFTTSETMQNAHRALEWLKGAGIQNPYNHVVAITANAQAAREWGALPSQTFLFWEWVGGRFSIWSSVALTTALAVGIDTLAGMQAGAHAMDQHFATAPVAENAPVQLAVSGVVNRSVLGYGSLNIAPYDFRLGYLVPYLQQLEMESLGKSVDLNGNAVNVPTGPAVWGMPGTDAQHTFFQWLHQGSDGAPVDFIVCQEANHGWREAHHTHLLANCLAQRQAMLTGKSYEQALQECRAEGHAEEHAQWLAKHRMHTGGRSSNLIVLPRLSPYTLGALLALYEHKVFTQAVIWGINPFDQWGVEYGKVLAKGITQELKGQAPLNGGHDASTRYWVEVFRG
ncbi:glucose-6-phosphate isomerase [Neopusillimonas maritima]|nr:glucose-6-phosphate isomerase [Neopusillimonas maritima]